MSDSQRKRAERLASAVRAAEIRDAARAIALEGGLNAVTLRSIATRVSVTPALIAHYEPSMDVLLATTFSNIVHFVLAEVTERLVHEPTPTDAPRKLINTLLEPERQETTAIWVDAWSLGRRNDIISDAVRVEMNAWQNFVACIVQAGIDSGESTRNEPDAVAWQLIGMIDGLNAQSLVRYRDAQSRSRLLTHAMEQGLGMTTGQLTGS